MARGTVIQSSLPQNLDPVEDDEPTDDEFLEPVDDEPQDEPIEEEEILDDEPIEELEPAPVVVQLTPRERVRASLKSDIERQAFDAGWVPEHLFRGPGVWRPAEEWMRRGREINSIVQKRVDTLERDNQRLAEENAALRERFNQQDASITELRGKIDNAENAGYERAMNELKARRNQALEAGDHVTAANVGDEMANLRDTRARDVAKPAPAKTTTEPPPQPQPQPARQLSPAIRAFMAANPWGFDPQSPSYSNTLNAAMIKHHIEVMEEMPGIGEAEQLDIAKERLMAEYPEKFGMKRTPQNNNGANRQRPRGPARPTPAGGNQAAGARKSAFDVIEDAQERADAIAQYRRQKVADPELTAAEYLRLYLNPHEDVLAVQRETRRPRPAPQRRQPVG